MDNAEEEWWLKVPNLDFDKIPEKPEKDMKTPDRKQYLFKETNFKNYVKMVNSQGYVEEYY